MILEELVLHNFGVFRGRQSISLAPPSSSKPIILIGGMNGVGKTTILDALQLAFYGKLARCSSRGAGSYDGFLRNSISRSAPLHEGAALELQFRHSSEGSEHSYRIHRSWSGNGGGIRERFEVLADGKSDSVLADSWTDQVERFIPSRISSLFFFDGEKIEAMADLDTSSQMLAVGIEALLGLDLVDKLATDLVVLERRKQSESNGTSDSKDLEKAKAELKQLEEIRLKLHSERATAQTELDRQEKRLRELKERFRAEGGELFQQRERLESEKKDCEVRLREINDELREVSAGAAPLLLASNLLKAVSAQARAEDSSYRTELLAQILLQRDSELLSELETRAEPSVIRLVRECLAEDRLRRIPGDSTHRYLGLDEDSLGIITLLLREGASQLSLRIEALTQQTKSLENALIDLNRTLVQVPDKESISSLLKELELARATAERGGAHLASIESDLDRARSEVEVKKTRLEKLLEGEALAALGNEDSIRVISHSRQVRTTLEKFRIAIVKRNIKRIEGLVLDSLRKLLRKESLVADLRIDVNSFQITLLAPDGRELSMNRLSAGERQLLAVALLWGLAKACGRPLPAVVDTPLGRLDTIHRANLVDRYFPYASHQVLLLSTDEEINERYYRKLRPFTGRSYLLDFDDARGETHIRPGYFW
jgi:DNA sulfur modification protein DndD